MKVPVVEKPIGCWPSCPKMHVQRVIHAGRRICRWGCDGTPGMFVSREVAIACAEIRGSSEIWMLLLVVLHQIALSMIWVTRRSINIWLSHRWELCHWYCRSLHEYVHAIRVEHEPILVPWCGTSDLLRRRWTHSLGWHEVLLLRQRSSEMLGPWSPRRDRWIRVCRQSRWLPLVWQLPALLLGPPTWVLPIPIFKVRHHVVLLLLTFKPEAIYSFSLLLHWLESRGRNRPPLIHAFLPWSTGNLIGFLIVHKDEGLPMRYGLCW